MFSFLHGDVPLRDALTTAAIFLSGFALYRSGRADKRDLFLRIHEMLLEPEAVQGRRRLYRVETVEDARAIHAEQEVYTNVHRSLALFDLLAKYVRNGWIDERIALEEWGRSLTQARGPGLVFIEVRSEEVKWRSWPDFLDLAERAKRFKEGQYTPERAWRIRLRRALSKGADGARA